MSFEIKYKTQAERFLFHPASRRKNLYLNQYLCQNAKSSLQTSEIGRTAFAMRYSEVCDRLAKVWTARYLGGSALRRRYSVARPSSDAI